MSEVKVNKISPRSGTGVQLGDSGDTITIPAGATLANAGTVTGIPTSALTGTIALNQMATGTDGNIISYDASGNPVAVATGSAGQVLTSAGAGAPPTFAAAAAGKILQVIADDSDSATATTSTSYVATALNVNITPSATSSKILVMATSIIDSEGTGVVPRVTLYRDTTELQNGLALNYSSAGRVITPITLMKLDSPSSTSQLTYKVYLKSSDGNNVSFNSDSGMRGQIVVIEVGA